MYESMRLDVASETNTLLFMLSSYKFDQKLVTKTRLLISGGRK